MDLQCCYFSIYFLIFSRKLSYFGKWSVEEILIRNELLYMVNVLRMLYLTYITCNSFFNFPFLIFWLFVSRRRDSLKFQWYKGIFASCLRKSYTNAMTNIAYIQNNTENHNNTYKEKNCKNKLRIMVKYIVRRTNGKCMLSKYFCRRY